MSFKDRNTASGLDTTPGFMIKQPGTPHRTQLPAWEKITKFRCFPEPTADGGWAPIRKSIEYDDFCEAVTAEPVVRKIGAVETFTYITRIPGADSDPTTKMMKSLADAIENSPHDLPREWCEWKRGKNRAAKYSIPRNNIFMQGAMIMINGEECRNKATGRAQPQFPSLFMGPVSTLVTFSRMGNQRVETYDGPAPDVNGAINNTTRMQRDSIYASMFALGDWCSAENGRVLRFYQIPGTQEVKPHYGIELEDVLPLGSLEARARELWVPWARLLRYHTAMEQIGYLLRAYPCEAVDFALGRSEFENLLPDGVRGSWQKLQNAMAGKVVQGLPSAATNQMAEFGGTVYRPNVATTPAVQTVQVTRIAPPEQSVQPAQTAAVVQGAKVAGTQNYDWGDGDGEADAAAVSSEGPAVPEDAAEFSNPLPGATSRMPTGNPSAASIPNTPSAAVSGGAIDPAMIREAIALLEAAKRKKA